MSNNFLLTAHERRLCERKVIKLRYTKRNTAWEGKCKGWVTPVTQPPQIQPAEITESILDGRLHKDKKENVHREHLHVARCDNCVLFTATLNPKKPSKADLNILKHRQQPKTMRNNVRHPSTTQHSSE